MSAFLDNQLDLYREQSEGWKADHADAMACYNLQDAIRFGLSIYQGLRSRAVSEYGRTVKQSLELCERFKWWHDRTQLLLNAIAMMESLKYKVEGSQELREAFGAIGSCLASVDRMAESLKQIESGQAMNLQDAMNALRSRHSTESAGATSSAA